MLLSSVLVIMDVQNLHLEWESQELVRERIRKLSKLCVHPATQKWCEPNRPNSVSNHCILAPALARLRETESWKLPYLEPLQVEIGQLFEKLGIPAVEKTIYTGAVELKRLLGFVKRRAHRKEVTKVWFGVFNGVMGKTLS